jgi:hypothetical protein
VQAQPDAGYSAATTTRYNWVKLSTRDPFGYEVCATKLRVDWYDYGGTLGFRSHSENAWAANPTPPGTHWYNSSYFIADPYIYYAWSRLDQSGNARCYNYDFQNTSLRTDAAHYMTITCYAGGAANYTSSWDVTGEYYWLLHADVFSGYGTY